MANVIKHKRGSGSDPSASDLILGELAIRTDTGKLFTKMDSGAIAEIAGGGSDIAINTLSSSSATGGGSATFNGSAYRFTLSAPPSVSAQQLLVSVNGVIQKPVAGTGQPSEGFSVDGNDIIFGDAPATGADFFILTFRSLGVSEPAANSVTNAKVASNAAIAGSKISPTFTSNITIENTSPTLFLTDTNNNSDYRVRAESGSFLIEDMTNSAADRFTISSSGKVGIGTAGQSTILHVVDSGTNAAEFRLENDEGYLLIRSDNNLATYGAEQHLFHNRANSTEYMRINSSGKVGIGTTNPTKKLTVFGTGAGEATLQIEGEGGADPYINFLANNTQHWSAGIDDSDNDSFKIAKHSALGTNDYFVVTTAGNVGIGTNAPTSSLSIVDSDPELALVYTGTSGGHATKLKFLDKNGFINAQVANNLENDNTGSNAAALDFSTATGGTLFNRLRITSNGKVGINTTTPDAKFEIADSSNPDIGLKYKGTSGGHKTRLMFIDKRGVTNAQVANILHNDNVGQAAASLEFATSTGGALTARMVINSSGDVGIGTTSPSAKLDIGGLTNTGGQNVDALKITRTDGLQLFGINWNVSANEVSFSGNTKNYVFKNKSSSAESIRFPATGGITFNGDTATANALDDYEEGTWTPAIRSGGGTITTIFVATYTKIGRLVHIQAYIQYNGSGSGSAFQISGLPYNAINQGYSAQVVDFGRGGKKGAYSRAHPGNNFLEFLYSSESTSSDRITIKGNQIGASYIIFSNTYQTN